MAAFSADQHSATDAATARGRLMSSGAARGRAKAALEGGACGPCGRGGRAVHGARACGTCVTGGCAGVVPARPEGAASRRRP